MLKFSLGLLIGALYINEIICLALPDLDLNLEAGTDTSLYNEELFQGDIVLPGHTKNAAANRSLFWPNSEIAYTVSSEIGCPSSGYCRMIKEAIAEYHEKTCIKFVSRKKEENYVEIFYNSNSDACYSNVGRHGGVQYLSLGYNCWYKGIILHELGHVAGLWHEMTRPDRDNYVTINWRNIRENFDSVFVKQNWAEVNTYQKPFDLTSVMMYDEFAFSKDNASPTITVKDGRSVIGPVWKKTALSKYDVQILNNLHSCKKSTTLKPQIVNYGLTSSIIKDQRCDFNYDICGFKNNGDDVWKWENKNTADGFVESSYQKTKNTTGYFVSGVFPGNGGRNNDRGCVKFSYYQKGHGSSFKIAQLPVKSTKQEVFDKNRLNIVFNGQGVFFVGNNWKWGEASIKTNQPFKLVFISKFSSKDAEVSIQELIVSYEKCE